MEPSLNIVQFFGLDAVKVGGASHRLPELMSSFSTVWKHAANMGQAIRLLATDPNSIRLHSPLRTLLEDILQIAITPGEEITTLQNWSSRTDISKPLRDVLITIRQTYEANSSPT